MEGSNEKTINDCLTDEEIKELDQYINDHSLELYVGVLALNMIGFKLAMENPKSKLAMRFYDLYMKVYKDSTTLNLPQPGRHRL